MKTIQTLIVKVLRQGATSSFAVGAYVLWSLILAKIFISSSYATTYVDKSIDDSCSGTCIDASINEASEAYSTTDIERLTSTVISSLNESLLCFYSPIATQHPSHTVKAVSSQPVDANADVDVAVEAAQSARRATASKATASATDATDPSSRHAATTNTATAHSSSASDTARVQTLAVSSKAAAAAFFKTTVASADERASIGSKDAASIGAAEHAPVKTLESLIAAAKSKAKASANDAASRDAQSMDAQALRADEANQDELPAAHASKPGPSLDATAVSSAEAATTSSATASVALAAAHSASVEASTSVTTGLASVDADSCTATEKSSASQTAMATTATATDSMLASHAKSDETAKADEKSALKELAQDVSLALMHVAYPNLFSDAHAATLNADELKALEEQADANISTSASLAKTANSIAKESSGAKRMRQLDVGKTSSAEFAIRAVNLVERATGMAICEQHALSKAMSNKSFDKATALSGLSDFTALVSKTASQAVGVQNFFARSAVGEPAAATGKVSSEDAAQTSASETVHVEALHAMEGAGASAATAAHEATQNATAPTAVVATANAVAEDAHTASDEAAQATTAKTDMHAARDALHAASEKHAHDSESELESKSAQGHAQSVKHDALSQSMAELKLELARLSKLSEKLRADLAASGVSVLQETVLSNSVANTTLAAVSEASVGKRACGDGHSGSQADKSNKSGSNEAFLLDDTASTIAALAPHAYKTITGRVEASAAHMIKSVAQQAVGGLEERSQALRKPHDEDTEVDAHSASQKPNAQAQLRGDAVVDTGNTVPVLPQAQSAVVALSDAPSKDEAQPHAQSQTTAESLEQMTAPTVDKYYVSKAEVAQIYSDRAHFSTGLIETISKFVDIIFKAVNSVWTGPDLFGIPEEQTIHYPSILVNKQAAAAAAAARASQDAAAREASSSRSLSSTHALSSDVVLGDAVERAGASNVASDDVSKQRATLLTLRSAAAPVDAFASAKMSIEAVQRVSDMDTGTALFELELPVMESEDAINRKYSMQDETFDSLMSKVGLREEPSRTDRYAPLGRDHKRKLSQESGATSYSHGKGYQPAWQRSADRDSNAARSGRADGAESSAAEFSARQGWANESNTASDHAAHGANGALFGHSYSGATDALGGSSSSQELSMQGQDFAQGQAQAYDREQGHDSVLGYDSNYGAQDESDTLGSTSRDRAASDLRADTGYGAHPIGKQDRYTKDAQMYDAYGYRRMPSHDERVPMGTQPSYGSGYGQGKSGYRDLDEYEMEIEGNGGSVVLSREDGYRAQIESKLPPELLEIKPKDKSKKDKSMFSNHALLSNYFHRASASAPVDSVTTSQEAVAGEQGEDCTPSTSRHDYAVYALPQMYRADSQRMGTAWLATTISASLAASAASATEVAHARVASSASSAAVAHAGASSAAFAAVAHAGEASESVFAWHAKPCSEAKVDTMNTAIQETAPASLTAASANRAIAKAGYVSAEDAAEMAASLVGQSIECAQANRSRQQSHSITHALRVSIAGAAHKQAEFMEKARMRVVSLGDRAMPVASELRHKAVAVAGRFEQAAQEALTTMLSTAVSSAATLASGAASSAVTVEQKALEAIAGIGEWLAADITIGAQPSTAKKSSTKVLDAHGTGRVGLLMHAYAPRGEDRATHTVLQGSTAAVQLASLGQDLAAQTHARSLMSETQASKNGVGAATLTGSHGLEAASYVGTHELGTATKTSPHRLEAATQAAAGAYGAMCCGEKSSLRQGSLLANALMDTKNETVFHELPESKAKVISVYETPFDSNYQLTNAFDETFGYLQMQDAYSDGTAAIEDSIELVSYDPCTGSSEACANTSMAATAESSTSEARANTSMAAAAESSTSEARTNTSMDVTAESYSSAASASTSMDTTVESCANTFSAGAVDSYESAAEDRGTAGAVAHHIASLEVGANGDLSTAYREANFQTTPGASIKELFGLGESQDATESNDAHTPSYGGNNQPRLGRPDTHQGANTPSNSHKRRHNHRGARAYDKDGKAEAASQKRREIPCDNEAAPAEDPSQSRGSSRGHDDWVFRRDAGGYSSRGYGYGRSQHDTGADMEDTIEDIANLTDRLDRMFNNHF